MYFKCGQVLPENKKHFASAPRILELAAKQDNLDIGLLDISGSQTGKYNRLANELMMDNG